MAFIEHDDRRVCVLTDDSWRRKASELCWQSPADWKAVFSKASSNDRRTAAQNRFQWPILQAFSRQVQWPVNGQLVYMSDAEWKDVLTAGFRRESLRLAMAIDNRGFVPLGLRTSHMTKKEFAEWQEYLLMIASERSVNIRF